jgi:hypothetical protein
MKVPSPRAPAILSLAIISMPMPTVCRTRDALHRRPVSGEHQSPIASVGSTDLGDLVSMLVAPCAPLAAMVPPSFVQYGDRAHHAVAASFQCSQPPLPAAAGGGGQGRGRRRASGWKMYFDTPELFETRPVHERYVVLVMSSDGLVGAENEVTILTSRAVSGGSSPTPLLARPDLWSSITA